MSTPEDILDFYRLDWITGFESRTLPQGSFVIGRAASCNIVCSDQAISSTHCILLCDGANLMVEDRSTNGTFLNAYRLPRCAETEYVLNFAETPEVLASTLRRSRDVSLTYRDTELDHSAEDVSLTAEAVDAAKPGASDASIGVQPPGVQSTDELQPQPETPLDFDVELEAMPSSDVASEPRGRKRRLSRGPSRPGHLSGPALLQWLKRRRCERQGEVPDDIGFSRSGDRRKGEQKLQEQVRFFKDFQVELDELILLSAPEMITSLRCAGRKKPKAGMMPSSDGFVTVLSSTRLLSSPGVAAQATDEWHGIHKSVVAEATKAFTRSKVLCSKPTSGVTFPWRSCELQEALDWEWCLQMLQDRCDLEPGRRSLMRCGGAQPKAGLFEDPPQGSVEATAAAAAVLQGCLPAQATGNEFRAATLLNTTGLSELLQLSRPGVLGTWHPIVASTSREIGFRDILHCLWSARGICVGISGHFVGRMTQAALTNRAFGPAGGQEHCQCSCGQWLTRGKLKGHTCEKHVGKPQTSAPSDILKLFWQSRGVLGFRASFKHHSTPPAVDLVLEAALDSAMKSILWCDFWEAAHVTCSWRLVGESTGKRSAGPSSAPHLKPPWCETVPVASSLTPQQLLLLGWMRCQEARESYSSRQVVREDVCESDLYLELLVERDFREKGGLIFSGAGRCLLDAPGTLVLAQGHSLPCWKAALEQSGVKVLCIQNQRRMRSLAVADILAADFILASLQLFSAEGYQRHFDALAMPGLELWSREPPPDHVAPREEPPGVATLGCGDVVQLHGLEKQAELNGRKGRLLEWQSSSGRWSCLLQHEKRKRKEVKQVLVNVRPCNIKAVRGRER
eukprot:Skav234783  [mRNA]  locus=scaffold69:29217:36988:+ [translate_table: standard]